jgi:hypothetical protein
MHYRAPEFRRILLLGPGVKIALGRLHFHGLGVARQGPWVTWVNKRDEEGRRPLRTPAQVSRIGYSG